MAGSTCINKDQLKRMAGFTDHLAELEDDIFPKLLRDCRDRATLHHLRSCGQTILRVHQSSSMLGKLFDWRETSPTTWSSTRMRKPYTLSLE
jgi:hypothetical protein